MVQVFVFCLFGDLGPAERALFVDQEGLEDALVAEVMVAVGRDWPEQGLIADCALVLVL